MTAAVIASASCVAAALVAIRQHMSIGRLQFWYEAWRQPYLAFALMARDHAWQVLPQSASDTPQKDGWIGPIPYRLHGLEFAVFVDEELVDPAMARVQAELVASRKAVRSVGDLV